MKKKSMRVILMVCWLLCTPGVGFSQQFSLQPGQRSLPPEVLAELAKELPGEKTLTVDLESLIMSYPGFIKGAELRQKRLYLILKNGERIIYDDGLNKGFDEKLNKPDIKDMLSQAYRPGSSREAFRPDYDPGRFRVRSFFDAVYGDSAAAVQAKLVAVKFCGKRVSFNAQNGAAKALEGVGQDLASLLKQHPQLQRYLFPLGGSFNWREIAGTARLSPHSWGIAIDLNPRLGAYWRGNKNGGSRVVELREKYPQEIVEVFEKHGFIWGGKWSHFDLMHFEYRPEMLLKWRLEHPSEPKPSVKSPLTSWQRSSPVISEAFLKQ
jgi:hypothetical protein